MTYDEYSFIGSLIERISVIFLLVVFAYALLKGYVVPRWSMDARIAELHAHCKRMTELFDVRIVELKAEHDQFVEALRQAHASETAQLARYVTERESRFAEGLQAMETVTDLQDGLARFLRAADSQKGSENGDDT